MCLFQHFLFFFPKAYCLKTKLVYKSGKSKYAGINKFYFCRNVMLIQHTQTVYNPGYNLFSKIIIRFYRKHRSFAGIQKRLVKFDPDLLRFAFQQGEVVITHNCRKNPLFRF